MKLATPAVVFVNLRPNASPDLDDLNKKNVELFKGYRMVSMIITLKVKLILKEGRCRVLRRCRLFENKEMAACSDCELKS